MAASQPFPRLLRWALLGPFAVWAIAYLLALAAMPLGDSNVFKGIIILATACAALVEFIAVPVALFLLVRRGPYVSFANIILVLLAGLPLLLVAFVVWVLNFGHFHI